MELIEGGIIVNTHGVRGAVKLEPWTDTPEFLRTIKRFFIGRHEYEVISSSVHKNHLLVTLDGIDSVQEAASLRGKTVFFAREDASLSEGEFFIRDLIGFDAINDAGGEKLGEICDFLTLPSNGVYVIKIEGRDDMLIPAVAEFVRKIDTDNRCVRFFVMEGL